MYFGPCQKYITELFREILNNFRSLTTFVKGFHTCSQGPKYVYAFCQYNFFYYSVSSGKSNDDDNNNNKNYITDLYAIGARNFRMLFRGFMMQKSYYVLLFLAKMSEHVHYLLVSLIRHFI